MEIGIGTAADIEAVGPLWRSMVAHHGEVVGHASPTRDPEQSWVMRREQYLGWLADGTGLLLLARRPAGDEVVGYAFGRVHRPSPTFDLGDPVGELESLAVAPAARGSGAGTALIEACRKELRQRGCTYWSVNVVEANTGAVDLYRRAGFRPWRQDLLGRLDA
ncbi:MAG TPA: GNAT family N-acetyltransferase [Pseudonocardia sp.]|nr:GNAT family N-acetyltransferase [Pseudonocardia sp.]